METHLETGGSTAVIWTISLVWYTIMAKGVRSSYYCAVGLHFHFSMFIVVPVPPSTYISEHVFPFYGRQSAFECCSFNIHIVCITFIDDYSMVHVAERALS